MREWLMRSAFNDVVKSPGNRERCTAGERLLLLSEMLSLQQVRSRFDPLYASSLVPSNALLVPV
jgi:hypothetical protein